jgi:hypothetical protein
MNIFLMAASQQRSEGADVTPDAVNWANILYIFEGRSETYSVNKQQITGITETITLSATWLSSPPPPIIIHYRVDSTNPAWSNGGSYGGSTSGWTSIASGTAFTVVNGDYVSFFCESDGVVGVSITITITNITDSNTVLDTFTATSTVLAPI